jgi:hypothetical protein
VGFFRVAANSITPGIPRVPSIGNGLPIDRSFDVPKIQICADGIVMPFLPHGRLACFRCRAAKKVHRVSSLFYRAFVKRRLSRFVAV